MAEETRTTGAVVGVTEHGNSAFLVTIARGALLDRRRIDLTHGLPTHPYHHEGSWAVGRYVGSAWAKPTTLPDALALIAAVHAAAEAGARAALEALVATLAEPVTAMAIRHCPPLPASVMDRITDTRANAMADSIMYRRALAKAAQERGWRVSWYDRERALAQASLKAKVAALGKAAGPPWQAAHKLAATAALLAAGG